MKRATFCACAARGRPAGRRSVSATLRALPITTSSGGAPRDRLRRCRRCQSATAAMLPVRVLASRPTTCRVNTNTSGARLRRRSAASARSASARRCDGRWRLRGVASGAAAGAVAGATRRGGLGDAASARASPCAAAGVGAAAVSAGGASCGAALQRRGRTRSTTRGADDREQRERDQPARRRRACARRVERQLAHRRGAGVHVEPLERRRRLAARQRGDERVGVEIEEPRVVAHEAAHERAARQARVVVLLERLAPGAARASAAARPRRSTVPRPRARRAAARRRTPRSRRRASIASAHAVTRTLRGDRLGLRGLRDSGCATATRTTASAWRSPSLRSMHMPR